MGRRPKDMSKSAPLDRYTPLSKNQFHLLAWVYIRGYRTAADSYITWSPKAFLGRSPTKTEAATLSRRAKGLVERGLLTRHGRELFVSDMGKQELAYYALVRSGDPQYDMLLARLNFETAAFDLGIFNSLHPTLTAVYRDELGLEHEAALEAAGKLHAALIRHGVKQARKALEELQNSKNLVHDPEAKKVLES